jgi:D-3-phosphoglycerate dehydrogenase / 2-oxoglutarate reductase
VTDTGRRPPALHLELDAYPEDAVSRLTDAFILEDGGGLDPADLPDVLRDGGHEVLFVRLGTRVDGTTIAQAPALRLVVTPTTGLDHLDVGALGAAGIRILSLRDARAAITSVHATAELTWALLLASMRHLPRADADVTSGHWRRQRFLGTELAGRTIGIVGHGRLGRRVAGYARAFGMQVLVHDIDAAALVDLGPDTRAVDVDLLLRSADVVSLHLPLEDSTRGWLDERRIAQLRDGAVVINTARGELVDEGALARALSEGRLGGVAVDVLADDANWGTRTGRSPLLTLLGTEVNLVVTPHIGGWARDAVATTRRIVTDLALEFMAEGGGFEPPRDVTPNTDSSRAP